MAYDFDKVTDRCCTDAIKYTQLKALFGREDLIPLWIADLEFETPQFITDALKKRCEHSLFGYTSLPSDYWQTISSWIEQRHGWKTKPEWMTFIPGIVKGLGTVINVFVKPDEKIIIQPPVYHPFRLVPQGNRRKLVYNPLKECADGHYEMDFENLEKVCDSKCRLLVLCNPHNPAGITWDRNTLRRLADFAVEHNLIVMSDEIHCDMALFGNRHIPFASVSRNAAKCSITFQAPSKTFNIAGLVSSYAIVANPKLRKQYFGWLTANELNCPTNMFATIATMEAFKHGDPWRREMLSYIEKNVIFTEQYLKQYIPQIKALRPQASFLMWIDCRGLGLEHDALVDLFVNKAHLALNDGEMFGKGGTGFMRLNLGEPRAMLEKALNELRKAVEELHFQ